jgi:hypothetical protein
MKPKVTVIINYSDGTNKSCKMCNSRASYLIIVEYGNSVYEYEYCYMHYNDSKKVAEAIEKNLETPAEIRKNIYCMITFVVTGFILLSLIIFGYYQLKIWYVERHYAAISKNFPLVNDPKFTFNLNNGDGIAKKVDDKINMIIDGLKK